MHIIMEVMDACGSHVIRMYDSAYSADSMELIPIVVHALRCAISPIGSRIDIVTHSAAFRPCVPVDLYRFGVNTEYIIETINGDSHILADFFCKTSRQFTLGIELSSADHVWQILLALMVQAMKEKIFTVEPESFICNANAMTSRSENLGITPQRGTFPSSLTRFPVKSLQIPRILMKFATKLHISSAIVHSSLVTTNSLIICNLFNFSIYKYLET